ncbi:MAG: STAS domain-containing protein [Streptomyces sp.]|uniref:STAS domain-containing protein n=1 Tax=Streptomyces sp. TaxID=1931 RepID=UPI0025E71FEF|nr:STAS domain-containing protein [Streptomyces sp.]MBW8800827.1 STAS domain-containing protein [Streptomyces sp.]
MLEPSERVPFAGEGGSERPSGPTTASLTTWAAPDGDRVTVTVSGEFCLDNSQELRHTLRAALARSAAGVDLDLGRLTFADCSALNVLLAARGQAVAAGKTIVVTAVSPAVERLLTFTDTYALFCATPDGPAASHGTDRPVGTSEPRGGNADDGLLRTELVQLRRAMRTRPDIDLARGILMATFGLGPDAAWEVLVTTSRKSRTELHHLATDVLTTVHGASLPDSVQKQLTAAVAAARGTDGRPHGATTSGAARDACQGRACA